MQHMRPNSQKLIQGDTVGMKANNSKPLNPAECETVDGRWGRVKEWMGDGERRTRGSEIEGKPDSGDGERKSHEWKIRHVDQMTSLALLHRGVSLRAESFPSIRNTTVFVHLYEQPLAEYYELVILLSLHEHVPYPRITNCAFHCLNPTAFLASTSLLLFQATPIYNGYSRVVLFAGIRCYAM